MEPVHCPHLSCKLERIIKVHWLEPVHWNLRTLIGTDSEVTPAFPNPPIQVIQYCSYFTARMRIFQDTVSTARYRHCEFQCRYLKALPEYSHSHPGLQVCKSMDARRIELHLQPLAIDVEYSHLQFPDGSMISVAAQVCCVSPQSSSPLLKSYCRHPILDAEPDAAIQSTTMRSCGGVRLSELHGAPSLGEVAAEGKLPTHTSVILCLFVYYSTNYPSIL